MDAEKMLNYLTTVSNKATALNLIMHLVVITAILTMFFVKNEKVRKTIVNSSILVLVLSVASNALINGNPFHIITFLILSVITGYVLFTKKSDFIVPQMSIRTLISFIFIAIGFWYPEFVNANKFELLFISPLGIVPCPTLLSVIGLLSLSYPKINKLQYSATIALGIIYGIIGTFVFKVYLDIALLIASAYGLINLYQFKSQRKKLDLTV